jgi:hypothetical protein
VADPVVVSNQPDHPYREISDNQRWHRAVTWAPPGGLDPVVSTRFGVGPDDLIGTMGSCFAQHLSRHLSRSGLGYFVAEVAPADLDEAEARRRQYGTFSARYGNVYTAAQAIQLFRRAYGDMVPIEGAWTRGSVFVDPFRPRVEPDGFADVAALEGDRVRHLAAVREVFERSTVLVFTLGLTEAWRSRDDGAVFATAPGVDGGVWDPDRYEFVNYGVDEVRSHLFELCDLVRSVNPGAKILLTVSPVPLVATYEPRHVLVSTTVSKAVLRVAAEEALARFDFVDYFPSYELIASATGITDSYEPDRRSVTDVGVSHVMRVFTHHYVDGAAWSAPSSGTLGAAASRAMTTSAADYPVICDEDAVLAAMEATAPGG